MNGSEITHFGLARQYANLKDELLDATNTVLKDGCLMNGPFTNKFENWLANKTKCSYVITVHSGTQALEIIAHYVYSKFIINKVQPTILVPNITYPATLNAFLNAGFNVELIDTDKNGIIKEKFIKDPTGDFSIICQVGLYGAPTHRALANHIIDAAQHWLIVDSSTLGLGMAISFDPTKNLPASGNGGAIATNDYDLYDFAINYRSNGKVNWHQIIGTNSRMSELDCAHLLIRANQLENWQWKRKQIRYYYLEQFKDLPLRCLSKEFPVHADQKFVVYTEKREDLHNHLLHNKIDAKIHYPYSLSELPIAKYIIKKPNMFSVSVMLTKGLLSLPIYPELSDGEVEYIASIVRKFFDK